MFLARIYVSLKPTVNDPEGVTIRGATHELGYASVVAVRSGKYFQVRLDDKDEAEARRKVEGMCKQLFANPVIEDYRFEVETVS